MYLKEPATNMYLRKRFFKNFLSPFLVFLLFGIGCTKVKSTKIEVQVQKPQTIHLAIWSNYVSQELLDQFEKNSGIKVLVSNFSSNEELLAKLQAGASGYDVIVPSDYMIFVMAKLGLLSELDRNQIPNSKNVDSQYLNKDFDPLNKYSLPYDFGTTGIAINHALFKGSIRGWKDLFESKEAAGKFTLLDDVRETLGAALKTLGKSLNSINPQDISQAKELLIKTKKNIRGFSSEPLAALVSGEVPIAHIYASDALQAKRKMGDKLEYLLPTEGATLWIDNLAIPKTSANIAQAHQLINFLLEATSVKSTVLAVLVSPTQKSVKQLLPTELQNNPFLFPGPKDLLKLEMLKDLGESMTQWDQAWTEIKAKE